MMKMRATVQCFTRNIYRVRIHTSDLVLEVCVGVLLVRRCLLRFLVIWCLLYTLVRTTDEVHNVKFKNSVST